MRTIDDVLDEIMDLVKEARTLTYRSFEVDEDWIKREAKALEEDKSLEEMATKL